MYYKVILGSTIVDAQERLHYVMWQEENQLLLTCSVEQANGIVSSDGSMVWHLDGLPAFSAGDYQTVRVVEIGLDEYEQLIEQLKKEEELPDASTDETETVLAGQSTTELLLTIQSLQAEIESLKEQDEFLSDCLLEMSEAVYV